VYLFLAFFLHVERHFTRAKKQAVFRKKTGLSRKIDLKTKTEVRAGRRFRVPRCRLAGCSRSLCSFCSSAPSPSLAASSPPLAAAI
jgi:hypothetical protein